MEILYKDKGKFDFLAGKLIAGGAGNLHIISDFDRTLTNGRESGSLISVLRDHGYLTPDYPAKAKELFVHYHSIEINENLPLAERKQAMEEWWRRHFNLLIESGLKRGDLEKAMAESAPELRAGVQDFFRLLKENGIPLLIFSSGGLGEESIFLFLKQRNLLSPNIHIISNSFNWGEDGRALSFKEPIIHSLNKDETVLENFPFFKEICARPNAILLGDSPADAGMAAGLKHNNLLKIGFYNQKDDFGERSFLKSFDTVITGQGTFAFLNEILGKIILAE